MDIFFQNHSIKKSSSIVMGWWYNRYLAKIKFRFKSDTSIPKRIWFESSKYKMVNEKCWMNPKKEAIFFCMRHFITSQIIHQIINCRKQHLPLQDWIFEICFWSTTREGDIFFKRTVSCFVMIIFVVLPYKIYMFLVSMMYTTINTNQD